MADLILITKIWNVKVYNWINSELGMEVTGVFHSCKFWQTTWIETSNRYLWMFILTGKIWRLFWLEINKHFLDSFFLSCFFASGNWRFMMLSSRFFVFCNLKQKPTSFWIFKLKSSTLFAFSPFCCSYFR